MAKIESKYTERMELLFKTGISAQGIAKASVMLLEEELSHPAKYGTWIVRHYESAVSAIIDGTFEVEELNGECSYLIEAAREEIRIFRKYGYEDVARREEVDLQRYLDGTFFG